MLPVRSKGPRQGQRWWSLSLALGTSLMLHLGGLLLWHDWTAGVAPASRAVLAVRLTPGGSGGGDAQPLAESGAGKAVTKQGTATAASDPPQLPRVAEGGGPVAAEPARADPAAVRRPSPPPSPVAIELLGQRRLAAQLPPWLSLPFVPSVPPGPWYFRRSELTVAARPLDEPRFDLPAEKAGEAAPVGELVLRVLLAADGTVDGVEVLNSSLPAVYGEAIAAAVARVRFRPGEIEGVAVSSETRFEVAVDGDERGSSHASDRGGGRQALAFPRAAPGIAR